MTWMELECNVAQPTPRVCVSLADKSHTFRNVSNDGRLRFDGLDVKWSQHPCESRTVCTFSASMSAAPHCCKRVRARAQLASI